MQWFEITPDGGETFRVGADSRDALVWEKAGRNRAVGSLTDSATARMADLYEIAHIAARRQGLFHGPLAEFETTCVLMVVQDAGDEEVADPTQQGHSPDG